MANRARAIINAMGRDPKTVLAILAKALIDALARWPKGSKGRTLLPWVQGLMAATWAGKRDTIHQLANLAAKIAGTEQAAAVEAKKKAFFQHLVNKAPVTKLAMGVDDNLPKAGAYQFVKGYTQPVKCSIGVEFPESDTMPTAGVADDIPSEAELQVRRAYKFSEALHTPMSEQRMVQDETEK